MPSSRRREVYGPEKADPSYCALCRHDAHVGKCGAWLEREILSEKDLCACEHSQELPPES